MKAFVETDDVDLGVTNLLTTNLQRLEVKAEYLLSKLEAEQNFVYSSGTLRVLTQRRQSDIKSRIGTVLGGMALAIGLIQGPGALHQFPSDVEDLGGDVIALSHIVAQGVSSMIRDILRSISELGNDIYE